MGEWVLACGGSEQSPVCPQLLASYCRRWLQNHLYQMYNPPTKDLGYQACKCGTNVDTSWLKMLLKLAYLMCFLF